MKKYQRLLNTSQVLNTCYSIMSKTCATLSVLTGTFSGNKVTKEYGGTGCLVKGLLK
jgi:hypothetical protein